ncbi:MAG: hypothetical protein ACLFUS_04190, partial [Candidatus Sumerlaeia bacterium]
MIQGKATEQERRKRLPVVRVGSFMRECLREGALEGRVHSVFARTLNWEDEAGRFFCVTSRRQGAAPFGMAAEFPEGFFLDQADIAAGARVRVREGILEVDGLDVVFCFESDESDLSDKSDESDKSLCDNSDPSDPS